MSTALITGASGGIGYELAKLFARDHHNLVLVARSGDKLTQVAEELKPSGVSIKIVALDLTEPPAPQFLFDQLQREGVTVDILVNNAGFGAYGEFATMPENEILGQISLNITALTRLTRLFLPPMLSRRSGRIMNVASTAGFQPGPLMAVYYATKAYVISFSEAIANEVQNSGVTVTCFCPGATETGFAKRAGNDTSRVFKRFGAMNADKVAMDGYRALMEGRSLAISGAQVGCPVHAYCPSQDGDSDFALGFRKSLGVGQCRIPWSDSGPYEIPSAIDARVVAQCVAVATECCPATPNSAISIKRH